MKPPGGGMKQRFEVGCVCCVDRNTRIKNTRVAAAQHRSQSAGHLCRLQWSACACVSIPTHNHSQRNSIEFKCSRFTAATPPPVSSLSPSFGTALHLSTQTCPSSLYHHHCTSPVQCRQQSASRVTPASRAGALPRWRCLRPRPSRPSSQCSHCTPCFTAGA